jgi:DNA (cytosine-5)-methyltransferase 1
VSIRYGSVCSGIEAASVAWGPLGWEAAWFSEIEPFPCAVLKHHYPTVPNLGDMTRLPARIRAGEVEAPDLLVGGTPCQSFSIGGWRLGLADPRGQLTRTYVEVLDAIDAVRSAAGKPPAMALWENVQGVLSDKGNAFGNFLAALCGEDEPLVAPRGIWPNAGVVLGPTREVAWRVLDAQYFGVPQRRRRVFLAARAGTGGVRPFAVLLVEQGVRRDSPPSRAEGRDVALTAAGGAEGAVGEGVATFRKSRRAQTSDDDETWVPDITANTLNNFDLGDTRTTHAVCVGMGARRLTVTECERLQGFPDGWTLIPWRGKAASECPDSPRVHTLGNSMAVPCMAWLGRRIEAERRKA